MDYQVDVAALSHDDKCRYWDDEEFCDCGAIDYEKLKQCEAKLTQVEQENIELRAELSDDTVPLYDQNRMLEEQVDYWREAAENHQHDKESAEQDRGRLAAEVKKTQDTLAMFAMSSPSRERELMVQRDKAEAALTAAQQEIQELSAGLAEFNVLQQALKETRLELEAAQQSAQEQRRAGMLQAWNLVWEWSPVEGKVALLDRIRKESAELSKGEGNDQRKH